MTCDFGALADEFGTPLYVIDLDAATDAFQSFHAAWKRRFTGFALAFSYKTNPLPAVTREFRRLGGWAEVVSGAELSWALSDGHQGDAIVFNGPMKTQSELSQAVSVQALVNVDSLGEVGALARAAEAAGRPARIGIRLRAEEVHGPPAHFGLSLLEAQEAATAITRAPSLSLSGVHLHIGTNVASPRSYAQQWTRILPLVQRLVDAAAGPLIVDVGGGYAAPPSFTSPSAPPVPSFDSYADALADTLAPVLDRGARVVAEPGRCLVEPHGFVVTRVQVVKHVGGSDLAILDGGVNLIPTVRQQPHPVRFESDPGACDGIWTLHGPLCMPTDVVATAAPGPRTLQPGDVVTVGNAGGYDLSGGFAWIRPHAPVVVLRDGKAELAHPVGPASLWRADGHLAAASLRS